MFPRGYNLQRGGSGAWKKSHTLLRLASEQDRKGCIRQITGNNYRAEISVAGVKTSIGTYASREEAISARDEFLRTGKKEPGIRKGPSEPNAGCYQPLMTRCVHHMTGEVRIFASQADAAAHIDCSTSSICNAAKGKYKWAKGWFCDKI